MKKDNRDLPFFDFAVEDGQCDACKYYDTNEQICWALECYGFDCSPLPCEIKREKEKKQ